MVFNPQYLILKSTNKTNNRLRDRRKKNRATYMQFIQIVFSVFSSAPFPIRKNATTTHHNGAWKMRRKINMRKFQLLKLDSAAESIEASTVSVKEKVFKNLNSFNNVKV